jgi:hypothetical protein
MALDRIGNLMKKKNFIISGILSIFILLILSIIVIIFDSNYINYSKTSDIVTEENEVFNTSFFNLCTTIDVGQTVYGLASTDFNKDGNMDFTASWADVPFTHSTISIFFNDGNTNFIRKDVFVCPYYIKDLITSDIDNDGDMDLIFTYNEAERKNFVLYNMNGTVNVLFNDGNCIFQNETMIAKRGTGVICDFEGRINPKISTSDYDKDGDIELLLGDNSGKVELYDNDGLGKFSTLGVIYDFGSCSWGLTSADFDNDSYIDFIVAARDDEGVGHLYYKKNNGLLNCFTNDSGLIIGNVTSFSASLTPVNYYNDGTNDLIVGVFNRLYLYFKNGEKYIPFLIGEIPYHNGTGEHLEFGGALASADFNNDGKIDFISGGSQGVIRLFINNSFNNIKSD